MKLHLLKTVEPHFGHMDTREKTFELRKNDRGYAVGDYLGLMQFDEAGGYGKGMLIFRVIHLLDHHPGLFDGYVIMSLAFVGADLLDEHDASKESTLWLAGGAHAAMGPLEACTLPMPMTKGAMNDFVAGYAHVAARVKLREHVDERARRV